MQNPDTNYDGIDRRQQSGWHIDKTISLSHVVATLSIAIAGIWYLADQDKRIERNAIQIAHVDEQAIQRNSVLDDRFTRHEQLQAVTLTRIDDRLEKIHEYLRDMAQRAHN